MEKSKKIGFIRQILVLYVLLLVKDVCPQQQPCLVCGGAVLRVWSFMSRQGDHYLRISGDKSDDDDDDNNNEHLKVNCGGSLQSDNFTSLMKIREKPRPDETRVQFIFRRNNVEYDLYAPSTGSELLAMPSSEGVRQTDDRNTFAPERLRFQHRLFTVYQSVKFRGYYLHCDGSGKLQLQKIINKSHRDPSHLFITMDPGNAIRGVAFGQGVTSRKKRELLDENEDDFSTRTRRRGHWRHWHLRKPHHHPRNRKSYRQKSTRRCIKPRPLTTPRPTQATTPTTTRPSRPSAGVRHSSLMVEFDLPDEITFVLCFWIRTKTKMAQLVSIVERVNQTMRVPVKQQRHYWKRSYYPQQRFETKTVKVDKNILNVSIKGGVLRLEIGYQRVVRTSQCKINDDKFHPVCVSLNDRYLLEIFKDGVLKSRQKLPQVACDLVEKKTTGKRRGKLTLGRPKDMPGQDYVGRLFQVNMWDKYPTFRIQRIATNCACGGGNLVSWDDLLRNGTMSGVDVSAASECPQLEGFDYDELTQSRLI